MAEMRQLFESDDAYEVQTMQVSSTAVLQARKTGTLRDLTGLSATLTIKVTPEHGGTRAEIGMQKWLDKAAVAAAVVILTGGVGTLLLALPALGAYWHTKLPRRMKIIEGQSRAGRRVCAPSARKGGTCGAVATAGLDVLFACGANLRVNVSCNSCGGAKDPTARYCNRCVSRRHLTASSDG